MNDDNGIQIERRQGAQDIHEIACFTHRLDTRVSVLETRIETQDIRLAGIERDVGETRQGINQVLTEARQGIAQVLNCLHEHVEQENKDRIRLLAAVVATLLSAISGLALAFINRLS